jgi:uncharacterized protein with HEPN domain
MLGSIASILDYTKGMTFDAFIHDSRTVEAVMHNIMVLGEAARSLPPGVISRHPEIPFQQMRDIRNVIVHIYFGVREDILWQTVRDDLPALVPQLKAILEEAD